MTTFLRTLLITALAVTPALAQTGPNEPNEAVGQHYLITGDDLPAPYATESVSNSGDLNSIPDPPVLNLPEGFTVNLYATGFDHARWLATAPNGDIFLAESREGHIMVLRDADGDGVAETQTVYWSHMNRPTGMVFRDDGLYVADTDAVWRFAYGDGDLEADSAPLRMTVSDALGGSRGHWTRTLAFAPDGSDFYVAVGSRDNESIESAPRATIQIFEDGSSEPRTFASGLRNAVGIAFHPVTDELYTVVNERDGYGDDLVPDYFTRVRDGDFYGWPYAYSGANPSPEYGDRAPELVAQSLEPDVMFQSHSAPLGLVFYDGAMFPADYQGDALVSLHGSWNRSVPAGYKIVRIRFEDGRPVGGYENFATGFWFAGEKDAELYGRPVGMTVTADGALLIADDGADVIWRIAYEAP
jgi:glucose/arabinose dehydrogenase